MTAPATIELFRPVGPRELARIAELGWHAFPARLHYQPIFYPVLNERYARQIARDWNASSPQNDFQGYVTRFHVAADYAQRFAVQAVGAGWHQELWVPAEELDEFNAHIVGAIELIGAFRGGPGIEPAEVEPVLPEHSPPASPIGQGGSYMGPSRELARSAVGGAPSPPPGRRPRGGWPAAPSAPPRRLGCRYRTG